MIQKRKRGFTLIELIITITLITILATLSYFSYAEYTKDAENTKKKADIDIVNSQVELQLLKKHSFPSKIQ